MVPMVKSEIHASKVSKGHAEMAPPEIMSTISKVHGLHGYEDSATHISNVAAVSRMDTGLSLPTMGLPHYLFIKRARQLLKKGLPMAVHLSHGSINKGPSPKVKEIVSSILRAVREKRYAQAGDELQAGLAELSSMVDLGKFVELLRGASRDSLTTMSVLFLSPASDAENKDLVKLAMLFPVLSATNTKMAVDTPTPGQLMERITAAEIFGGPSEYVEKTLVDSKALQTLQSIGRQRGGPDIQVHSKDRVSFTGLLCGVREEGDILMLREAHTLVCATPSPHALYTRMTKKMIAKATMETRCIKAGITDASSLPRTSSVYESAHNAVLKAIFLGHILVTSEEDGLLAVDYAECWTMKDFSDAAAEKVSILSNARRDYAESGSEQDQEVYAGKLEDHGVPLCMGRNYEDHPYPHNPAAAVGVVEKILTELHLGTMPRLQAELPDMIIKMILDALDRQVDRTSTDRDMLILAASSVKVMSPKQDLYLLNKLLEQGGRAILSCSNAMNFWTSVRCSQIFKAFRVRPFEREVDEHGWCIEGSSYAERLVRELPSEPHLIFTSGQSLLGGAASATQSIEYSDPKKILIFAFLVVLRRL